jgi:uroporphyrinogen decarboxylase
MTKEMTSRERVQCVLSGGIPDRVPFNFWMDRDKMAEYDQKWGADFRLTHYGVDVIEAFQLINYWPTLTPKMYFDGKTYWQTEPMVESLSDALNLPLPDPTNTAIYADIEEKRAKNPDKAIFVLANAPLGIFEPLRLAENLYMELYDCADEIHEILTRMKPVMMEATRRTCALDIDVLYVADDICGRDGALVSPKQLREFHFNYLREVVDIAHEAGKKVFYHTDGRVTGILDLFMEYGYDGINPYEPRYNDAQEFVDRTNGKLMLYGTLDNCKIIPDGTVEDIQEHVREKFRILGKEGRLIFSTHDIPAHCPQENLDALVETIKSCRY